MKLAEPPFNSGEIVTGKVVGLGPRFAALNVRRSFVPLDQACIDWNALRSPGEVLSIGDRLDVVVYADGFLDRLHHKYWVHPRQIWNGLWASRLPLLEDPWPALKAKYGEGSVVEVEMIDYVNWYIARVRMPEGLVVELRTNDIHVRTRKSVEYVRPLHPGERFKVVFRRLYRPGGWVERFIGESTANALAEAGYTTPSTALEKLTEIERNFIKRRHQRYR